jgi:hypothetical protein
MMVPNIEERRQGLYEPALAMHLPVSKPAGMGYLRLFRATLQFKSPGLILKITLNKQAIRGSNCERGTMFRERGHMLHKR